MKRMKRKGNESSDGKQLSESESNISRHKHERKGDTTRKKVVNSVNSRTAQITAIDSFCHNPYTYVVYTMVERYIHLTYRPELQNSIEPVNIYCRKAKIANIHADIDTYIV